MVVQWWHGTEQSLCLYGLYAKLATELKNIIMEAQNQRKNLVRMKKEQENKPETCRNSPDMLPYLWTECSNAFFTVDPFIWIKSTVPPNGRTVIISSMVIEPIDNHTYHPMVTRSRTLSSEAFRAEEELPFLLRSSMGARMDPLLNIQRLTWFHCGSLENLMLWLICKKKKQWTWP